jgi:hypothetical protein
MSALRALAIQGPLPAAVTNSLSDPLTGGQLRIDTLERVSLVCAWSVHHWLEVFRSTTSSC